MVNKSVVIVGASSGIGKALAKLCAGEGATVHLISRSEDKLNKVKNEIGERALVHPMDMLDEDSVNKVFSDIGEFDYLTVSAVADETKLMQPIKSMSTEIAQRGMEKFWGTFNCCRAASNHISSDGAIVVTSSIAIDRPSKNGASVMNAASAAVNVFAKALALEIAPVRVNVIAPGVVGTGVWSEKDKESYEKWGKETLLVGHLGKAEELAHAYYSLLTNTYISGSTLAVDGGLTLL